MRRTRQIEGSWKIMVVYYDGISQLTLRRSDFGAAIAAGGAPVLIAHLNVLTDGFLKR
jgi:ABC-type transporter MlaC component